MDAEILTIGSELTSGATINTNASYLARCLLDVGIPCRRQTSVPDDRPAVRQAVREALARCDLLILTGGLGPTFDDITMEALGEALSRPLAPAASAAAAIRRFYARRHRRLQRAALRQAWLPRGAEALPNRLGTAPGVWLSLEHRRVIALPGVPAEMRAMMKTSVLPRLRALARGAAIACRTLRTAGLVELEIERIVKRLRLPPAIQIGLYPSLRMVDVRLITSAPTRRRARALLAPAQAALRRALGMAVYGTDDETLEAVIGRLLLQRLRTVAVAESCTGGMILDRLTDVPGSSRYVLGGVMAYHNRVKQDVLGVDRDLLQRHGAVSRQVAAAMADGVRRLTQADIGVSVTGIAGPGGGTAAKPVGLVWFGLATPRGAHTLRRQFIGDRRSIKAQAAQTALNWLRLSLTALRPAPRTWPL